VNKVYKIYKMVSRICVSISETDLELIKRLKLKPSAILRRALSEYEEIISNDMVEDRKVLNLKITRLTNNLTKMARFLNEKGVYDEFLEQKD
jgi:hypothetical protein